MQAIPTAADIEKQARSLDLSIVELCRRASVDPTTFHRWKTGGSPSLATVSRLMDAISFAQAARNAAKEERNDR